MRPLTLKHREYQIRQFASALERHLIRPSRAGDALHIVIEPDETKNREPLEYPLPPGSVALIERYLAQFRPALAPVGSTALFPGGSDGCKHGNTVREQIGAAVFADTGMRVNPHLFRHIAAKLFLDANPGSYEVIRRVLGHRSIETTTAFYNRAGNGRRHPPLRRDHPQAAGDRRPAVNPLHFDPDRRGMPVVEWPAHDRQIWQAALVQGDLLEDGGDRACYATETNRKLAKNYGRWLTWLGRQGLLDEHTPPADRITPERVKAFVADMCVTTDNVAA